jgi:hypothetical protein
MAAHANEGKHAQASERAIEKGMIHQQAAPFRWLLTRAAEIKKS